MANRGSILNGLVVDEPWISLILQGRKTWEMRTTHTNIRGQIALIRKGSGHVVGVADLIDVVGPLDAIAFRAHRSMHCIPVEKDELGARWHTAWELENAKALARPVSYDHPFGAVIWVSLSEEVAAAVRSGIRFPQKVPNSAADETKPAARQAPTSKQVATKKENPRPASGGKASVPFAKDGTWFGPHLARGGKFTVGAKGEEEAHTSFERALEALTAMSIARWRRPNSKGNWGIVTAVGWTQPGERHEVQMPPTEAGSQ